MKLKLSQIINARDALTRLASEKYPAHIAYRIQRNIRTLEPEASSYYKTRDGLIKDKYGAELNPEGQPGVYTVLPEKAADFMAEINPLLDEQVDVAIMTIDLNDLHEISPLDLMALEWMFNEPSPDQEQKQDQGQNLSSEEAPAGTYRQPHRVRRNR